jgi:hypothetical protein
MGLGFGGVGKCRSQCVLVRLAFALRSLAGDTRVVSNTYMSGEEV